MSAVVNWASSEKPRRLCKQPEGRALSLPSQRDFSSATATHPRHFYCARNQKKHQPAKAVALAGLQMNHLRSSTPRDRTLAFQLVGYSDIKTEDSKNHCWYAHTSAAKPCAKMQWLM
jgi:hypothetical protein